MGLARAEEFTGAYLNIITEVKLSANDKAYIAHVLYGLAGELDVDDWDEDNILEIDAS